MTHDTLIGILEVVFGGMLAVHCPRAALHELKAGVAKGRVNSLERHGHPAAFWLSIGGSALAGVLGFFFFLFGLGSLGVAAGLIK